jgi:hypothetical protein
VSAIRQLVPHGQTYAPMQLVPPGQSRLDQHEPPRACLHTPFTQWLPTGQAPSSRQHAESAGTQVPGESKASQSALQGQTNTPEHMKLLAQSVSRQQPSIMRCLQIVETQIAPAPHSPSVAQQALQPRSVTVHFAPSQVATR